MHWIQSVKYIKKLIDNLSLMIFFVANFHLRNGACAHQIHWQADTSDKGLQESFGIMINYNYIQDSLEANHRSYLLNGTIAVSDKQGWLSQHKG